jgi:hypothetical protein
MRLLLVAVLAFFMVFPAPAEEGFGLWLGPSFALPLGNDNFSGSFTGLVGLDWQHGAASTGRSSGFSFGFGVNGGYTGLGVDDGSDLSILEAALGPLAAYRVNDRFSLTLQPDAGVYRMSWNSRSEGGSRLGAVLSGDFRLSPSFALRAFGAYTRFTNKPALHTLSAGLAFRVNLTELFGAKNLVSGEIVSRARVFPVSYAWYGENAFATLRIVNNEPYTISAVSVSFFLERYMNRPGVIAVLPSLAPGEAAELPVTALFNESMLDLTGDTTANALIAIEYLCLGSKKRSDFLARFPVYHRNAMSWDDDRRAASFVSSRDPAAVLFARYAASVIRDSLDKDVPPDVQYALGLFAALDAYGINYVVDPASSYIEKSEDASALDTLNYPYQSLAYRGGDCDDLAILFCSMLEVLGIPTAFITIPGHIYMAFDPGAAAGDWISHGDTRSRLVEHEGRLWLPVEITIPRQGFSRAWRIGLENWQAAGKEARLYPMGDNWKAYPPVSVPGAGDEMPDMPDEETLLRAFKRALNEVKQGG